MFFAAEFYSYHWWDMMHVAGLHSAACWRFLQECVWFAGFCAGEGDGKWGRLPLSIKPPSPAPVFLFLLPGLGAAALAVKTQKRRWV